MIDWSWVIDNRAMIGDLLWQHARMVLLALLFGSLPVSYTHLTLPTIA